MRLAAIYIEDHDYLIDQPQTINFGGKYFYDFSRIGKSINVTRKINELYIEGFFNLLKLDSQLTQVNAIVGVNGSGKSTLLDIIRSCFIEHPNALPSANALILIEQPNSDLPVILRNDFNRAFLMDKSKKDQRIELIEVQGENTLVSMQSIYYSPHYDYKFNPNFDDVDNHDISFDKILQMDLKGLQNRSRSFRGRSYSPSQELLFKNSKRQIMFLGSDMVQKDKVFKDIFHFQNHYEPILVFRKYDEVEKYWNVPMGLRRLLEQIERKLEEEIRIPKKISKLHKDRQANLLQRRKHELKIYAINAILNTIHKQMESKNSYLEEGFIPIDAPEMDWDQVSPYDLFIFFIEYASISLDRMGVDKSNAKRVFDAKRVKKLFEKLHHIIDELTDLDSLEEDMFKTSTENAIEILSLQREFISRFNKYYIQFNERRNYDLLGDNELLEDFISYMPFQKRLSSGENALLNLFSRLYDFLHTKLILNKARRSFNHYILLLDEADLSFHPRWKQSYVKALVSTIPHFFNMLAQKPTVQIIFTTHDPLALSDLPNNNIIYLDRESYDVKPTILDYNDNRRPKHTFGANISDLLSNSFFIDKTLIGDFATEKIQDTIKWLNDKEDKSQPERHKKLIEIIDEPIVKRKLAEMYDDKMNEKFQVKIINDQINDLLKQRDKLQNQ